MSELEPHGFEVILPSIDSSAEVISGCDAFLVLIIHLVILFWLALWFAGELVHRWVQDPFATAVFVSVVHAWVLATMLVTT